MKIAENYKEIISLWEKDYKSMLGKWITDYAKNEYGNCCYTPYPFRARCSIFNAIILLMNLDFVNHNIPVPSFFGFPDKLLSPLPLLCNRQFPAARLIFL